MTFAPSVEDRWFEDYVPGTVHELGSVTVDEAEVIAFGRAFDPQPYHVDPEAARHGPFGGLIASGWHTASLMMRVYAQTYLSNASSLGSPGVDELRWLRPVRPGDRLSVRVTIVEARRSRSKSDRGLVRSGVELRNQDGELVSTMLAMNLVRCRPGIL